MERRYNHPVKTRLCLFPLLLLLLLTACRAAPASGTAAQPLLVYARLDPDGVPHLVAQPGVDSPAAVLPLAFPADCVIYNLYASPDLAWLAVEFVCGGGLTVQVYSAAGGTPFTPVEETDSRFLAWAADSRALYLQTDTYGGALVGRYDLATRRLMVLDLPGGTYDLAVLPDGNLLFSQTQGLGFGSEVRRADGRGRASRTILTAPDHIVAYLRPSPDGRQVAYILLPDSQVPFPVGELWCMDADGGNPRFLAPADAGHGYAPSWSPDGSRIAFVGRENPTEAQADQVSGALVSNLYLYDLRDDSLSALTAFPHAIVETPVWAPDGSALAFNVINDGTIHVWLYEIVSGTLRQVGSEPSCCAVWLTGR
jgi:dipeptidyl aminopeptidase/acylaminoacyl peptidase